MCLESKLVATSSFRIRPSLLPQGVRTRQAHWELSCRVPPQAKGFCTNGYRSPYEKYEHRFPGGIAGMLNDLHQAEKMEFRPMVNDIGFPRPLPDDPRARKPKVDEADYAERSSRHTMLSSRKGMCTKRFSTSVTTSHFSPLSLRRRMVQISSATSREIHLISRCGRSIGSSRLKATHYDSTSREPFNASYLLACLDVPFSPQKVKARISKAALLAKRNPT